MKAIFQEALPGVPCVVLSGGQSRRFGTNKALARLDGERMIDVLIGRLRAQTRGPIAINALSNYGLEEHPVLADRIAGRIGPLGGIHAALYWAKSEGFGSVITVPVDTPILPDDFVRHLLETGLSCAASHDGRLHAVHGLWSVDLLVELEQAIQSGMRSARDWHSASNAKTCVFPVQSGMDPFMNINTPDDLEQLAGFLAEPPR